MPKSLTVTLANLIYFEKAQLPQALANRLIRLAAFQNPEFYKAQAMRMSVWDKPRVIGCAESYPHHIALPRGCLDAALSLLRDNGFLLIPRGEVSEIRCQYSRLSSVVAMIATDAAARATIRLSDRSGRLPCLNASTLVCRNPWLNSWSEWSARRVFTKRPANTCAT
jgi:hypothetical protein